MRLNRSINLTKSEAKAFTELTGVDFTSLRGETVIPQEGLVAAMNVGIAVKKAIPIVKRCVERGPVEKFWLNGKRV